MRDSASCAGHAWKLRAPPLDRSDCTNSRAVSRRQPYNRIGIIRVGIILGVRWPPGRPQSLATHGGSSLRPSGPGASAVARSAQPRAGQASGLVGWGPSRPPRPGVARQPWRGRSPDSAALCSSHHYSNTMGLIRAATCGRLLEDDEQRDHGEGRDHQQLVIVDIGNDLRLPRVTMASSAARPAGGNRIPEPCDHRVIELPIDGRDVLRDGGVIHLRVPRQTGRSPPRCRRLEPMFARQN